MLELAIKHRYQLENLQYDIWFNDKYKFWNANTYYSSLQIDTETWDRHQFVSIKDDKVLGYISYNISRTDNSVHSLNIINFSDNIITFGMDLRQALRDIFEKYDFRKLIFEVIIGNPIEKTYDKMIKKYGGHIVGILKSEVKLIDGKYYDKKIYEILKDDYFNAINEHKKDSANYHEDFSKNMIIDNNAIQLF